MRAALPQSAWVLGKAYLALADYPNAKMELEKAATSGLRLPYSHYYIGVLYQKTGKFDAAPAEFAKETEISPNDHWAYEDLTKIKLDQGETGGAISVLESAVKRNPDAPTLRAALAKAYLQAGEAQRGIAQLEHAIALDPGNSSYHYQLGRAYLKAGRQREAGAQMAAARRLQVQLLEGQMEALSRDQDAERTLGERDPRDD